jgi:chemotaxis protein methyltransferase CheR
LSDYYHAAHDNAVMAPALRERITFADHSLATDSAFSEVQFISCRNVLIYFDRDLQDRAIGLFRDSLCHRGFLCLGAKEALRFSSYADCFEEFRGGERIFRKVSP